MRQKYMLQELLSLFKPAGKSLFLKRIAQWLCAWSCLGKLMGAASSRRFDPRSFHLLQCFHLFRLICRSRARSRFVVDFSILLILLFSVTCIFRSLDLASSVSASNVGFVCLSLFISIYKLR